MEIQKVYCERVKRDVLLGYSSPGTALRNPKKHMQVQCESFEKDGVCSALSGDEAVDDSICYYVRPFKQVKDSTS